MDQVSRDLSRKAWVITLTDDRAMAAAAAAMIGERRRPNVGKGIPVAMGMPVDQFTALSAHGLAP